MKMTKINGEWIRVEEDLPEEHESVIAAYHFGFVVANFVEGEWWDDHARVQYKVTHWMPIVGPEE